MTTRTANRLPHARRADAPERPRDSRAFTLIEMLVVIAVVGVLAAILLPALAAAKRKAESVQCLNNLKQLTLAWSIYPDEHDGRLPPNQPYEWDRENVWVKGVLNYNFLNRDNTNTIHLTSGYVGRYHDSARIFKCPGDKSEVNVFGQAHARVRSVAMNSYLGMPADQWEGGRSIRAVGDLEALGAANTFVMLVQREENMNDAWFRVDMRPGGNVEWPGFYHDGAENISFADGRVERRVWTDPDTTPPLRPGQLMRYYKGYFMNDDGDNEDIAWLRRHATLPVSDDDELR